MLEAIVWREVRFCLLALAREWRWNHFAVNGILNRPEEGAGTWDVFFAGAVSEQLFRSTFDPLLIVIVRRGSWSI